MKKNILTNNTIKNTMDDIIININNKILTITQAPKVFIESRIVVFKLKRVMRKYLKTICKEKGIKPNFNKMDDELFAELVMEATNMYLEDTFNSNILSAFVEDLSIYEM